MRYSYEPRKLWRKWLQTWFGFANHLIRFTYYISWEKWVGKKSNHSKVVYRNVNPLLGFLTAESQNPKVDMPNLDYLSQWHTFTRRVCGSTWLQEEIRKDMRSKEIGMHAQDMKTVLDSIVNTIKGTYMTFQWAQESLRWQRLSYSYSMTNEKCEESGYGLDLDCLTNELTVY